MTSLSGIIDAEAGAHILPKISLIALDLDGTTLNSKNELTEKTLSTLRRLSQSGVRIVIATGRSAKGVHKHIHHLSLNSAVPTICCNGCCGLRLRSEGGSALRSEVIFNRGLSKPHCRELIEFAVQNNFVLQYYGIMTGDIYAVNRRSDDHSALLGRYSALTDIIQIDVDVHKGNPSLATLCNLKLDEFLDRVPASKVLILHSNADELLSLAAARFPADMFTVIKGSPHPFFVEFLPVGITKGDGMKILCESMNPTVPLSEVVAFGDGQNDVEFLSLAGHGVAVGNAVQVAKEAADVVLDRTNDEDAVAHYLEYLEANAQLNV